MLLGYWETPPVVTLALALHPASAIGWCMSVLWAEAINSGLMGHAPGLPLGRAERPGDEVTKTNLGAEGDDGQVYGG
jgi:hypothetical protein